MSEYDFHPLVKQLLDGDITIADLPAELRAEGEEALRLLAAVDRSPVALAAALVLWMGRSHGPVVTPGSEAAITVHFVLSAPDARAVNVAGTFNQWDPRATPLVRAGANGMWTATLKLPAGQHQYAFVVDGVRWVPDPAAPAVDDGYGRRNSVLTL